MSIWERDNEDLELIRQAFKNLSVDDYIETGTKWAMKTLGCLRAPFPDNYEKYYPTPSTFSIPLHEQGRRQDLRHLCVFTIDPSWAVDFDDALSVTELENGNYEVGVHIADVTYFFKPDTPFDDVVKQKGASLYFDHKVYHLLPQELIKLSSLTAGNDRLAVSLFWEFTPDGVIVSHRIVRSIIHSCAQFCYENVQTFLETGNVDKLLPNEINLVYNGFDMYTCAKKIKILHNITSKLHAKREKSGHLYFYKNNVKFIFDENYNVADKILSIPSKEACLLVEELMLLANVTVGTILYAAYPNMALLRSHSSIHINSLKKLKTHLEKIGISIDVSSNRNFYRSLLQHKDNRPVMEVIHAFLSRRLPRAKYVSSSSNLLNHFGLNISLFTHFTSPIRRYADQVVHRLLAGALGFTEKPNWTSDYINTVAVVINSIQKRADKLQRTVVQLTLSAYLRAHKILQSKCVVVLLTTYYIHLVSLEYNFSIFISLLSLQSQGAQVKVTKDGKVVRAIILYSYKYKVRHVFVSSELDVEQYIGNEGEIESRILMES